MRIAEALRLERGDLDFDNLLIKVHGKGGKQRLVPMSLELRKVLFRFIGTSQSGPVFASRSGTRLGQRNKLRDFKAFGERIGAIRDVRCSFHTLRHTFALNYIGTAATCSGCSESLDTARWR
jgi:integrase